MRRVNDTLSSQTVELAAIHTRAASALHDPGKGFLIPVVPKFSTITTLIPNSNNTPQSSLNKMEADDDLENTPYLRLMKTNLNFFMTRLLFMQEREADSLGAQNARRMNQSNSSMNFNNSASRVDQNNNQASGSDDGNGILKYFDEQDEEEGDDICVYNDNARILPNTRAVSYPPVPFPKAAPESPRAIEGKDGVKIVTPTHQTVDPLVKIKANSLPAPPLTDVTGDMTDMTLEEGDQDDNVKMSEDHETTSDVVPSDYEAMTDEEDSKPAAVQQARKDLITAQPAPARVQPPQPRVFPKNQRRSKRYSSRERMPVKRAHSLGRKSDSSDADSIDTDDMSLPNMSSHSYSN